MTKLENQLTELKKHPAIRLALLIAGAFGGTVALYLTIEEIKSSLTSVDGFTVFMVSAVVGLFVIATFVAAYMVAERSWRKHSEALCAANAQLAKNLLPEDDRHRFEDIENTSIRVGWLPFYPTLVLDPGGKKRGIGPGILSSVFNGRVRYARKQSNWGNILDRLISREFDIVATPMYDIKERRTQVEFTSPIFYADIGIFASSDNPKIKDALGGKNRVSFVNALKALQPLSKALRFCIHPGELQDKMVTKYFPGAKTHPVELEEFSVNAALEAMVEQEDEYASDLYFCERVQGESHWMYRDGRIFNLLTEGELLFPVAFALRRGDETLRKLINLRLMTIESDPHCGIVEHLVEHSRGILSEPLMKRVHEYFLRTRGMVRPFEEEEGGNVRPLRG